jgi:hypothetical protein
MQRHVAVDSVIQFLAHQHGKRGAIQASREKFLIGGCA